MSEVRKKGGKQATFPLFRVVRQWQPVRQSGFFVTPNQTQQYHGRKKARISRPVNPLRVFVDKLGTRPTLRPVLSELAYKSDVKRNFAAASIRMVPILHAEKVRRASLTFQRPGKDICRYIAYGQGDAGLLLKS